MILVPHVRFPRSLSWPWKDVLVFHTDFNTLRLRQDGRHFPDIFKCIFLNENFKILIKISLKFVPKGPINNISIGSDNGSAPSRRQAII